MAKSPLSIAVVAAGGDRDDAMALASLARRLACEGGGTVHALATGDSDDVRGLAAVLAGALAATPADVVLLPDTPDSRILAALLAESLDAGILTRCTSVARSAGGFEVACATYGGVARAHYRLRAGDHPWVLAVDAQAITGSGETDPVPVIDVAAPAATSHVQVLSRQARQPSGLAGARVVVTGGGGLRSEEDYRRVEQLAELLGGVAGASKPAVVRGWARAEQKVGLTGARVSPDVYIALGVSGASQHMAGCARARVVVAVNIDRRAPIFAHATYGAVADVNTLLPVLIDAVRNAR
ncbi:MAG TPA: electron transfer flavoprotein subunit alpha/FixB family protein [Candidatus Dormibacteraeota bacterium]|jgi:electron transfer flavoprotein alpha subunit|nr:electron transfer flavoprotein subunit alpha/FixB family protein [Candidatus Dormibacteraeota bacterium]